MPSSTPITTTALHDGPIDPGDWLSDATVAGHDAGAEAVFLGRTRPETHPQHGALVRLEYHAYADMARAQLRQLAEHVGAEHGLTAVTLVHATGPVALGEVSVLVRCLAPHRDAAFAGCRNAIDTLKRELPVWKREVWADGATFQAGQPAHSMRSARVEA